MPDEIVYDESYINTLEEDATPVDTAFDPDADYAAAPPPLPDAWWQAKIKNLGAKDKEGVLRPFVGPRPWGNIPQTFFTQVEFTVVDPGGAQDGKRTNRYNVTTHTDVRQNNSSSAALLYRALKGTAIPGATQGAQMKALMEALQEFGDGVTWIKTQLEGEPSEASKAYSERKKAGTLEPGDRKPKTYRGQKAFTDEQTGKVTGVTVDPETGERVVGRPAVQDVKPATFTPPSK